MSNTRVIDILCFFFTRKKKIFISDNIRFGRGTSSSMDTTLVCSTEQTKTRVANFWHTTHNGFVLNKTHYIYIYTLHTSDVIVMHNIIM